VERQAAQRSALLCCKLHFYDVIKRITLIDALWQSLFFSIAVILLNDKLTVIVVTLWIIVLVVIIAVLAMIALVALGVYLFR